MLFPFSGWLKPARRCPASRRSHFPYGRARQLLFIPHVERLEDRTVPSTLTVVSPADDGSGGTLRSEINQAKSGDIIVFAQKLRGQTIKLAQGPLGVGVDLKIVGLGAAQLTIDGAAGQIFHINSGTTVAITGLTLTNGLAAQGGGIDSAGNLTLQNDVFSKNLAQANASGGGLGGGIFNEPGATLTIIDSLFVNNQVQGGQAGLGNGGGLMNEGAATVTGCIFTGNQAIGGGAPFIGYGGGGAISSQFNATLTIRDSSFTNNSAIDGLGLLGTGGALDNEVGSSLTVSHSSFTGNQAITQLPINTIASGGALDNFLASMTIRDCIFKANRAVGLNGGVGGAVDNEEFAQGSITACTFIGNVATGSLPSATGAGGAVRNIFNSTLTITNSILVGNKALGVAGSAFQDGGAAVGGGLISTFGCILTLDHCAVVGNQALGGGGGAGAAGGEGEGGGLTTGVSIFGTDSTVVNDCVFTANQAIGSPGGAGGAGGPGQGGGMVVLSFPFSGPTYLTVTNSSIAANVTIGGAGAPAGAALGGGIYDEGEGILSVAGSAITGNFAVGGLGVAGANGGDATGGAIATATDDNGIAGTVTVNSSTLSYNLALGGAGANGGNGFGGGIYVVAGATVNVAMSRIAYNRAQGGEGDDGGTDGQGVGGGVYNLGAFTFDLLTVIAHNHASTSNDDIFP